MAMMAMANQGFIVFLLMLIISFFKFGVSVHDQCGIAVPAPAPDLIDAE